MGRESRRSFHPASCDFSRRPAPGRRERDSVATTAAIEELKRVARLPEGSDSNLMVPIIEAVRAYATMGEICKALKDVFGEYVERGRV